MEHNRNFRNFYFAHTYMMRDSLVARGCDLFVTLLHFRGSGSPPQDPLHPHSGSWLLPCVGARGGWIKRFLALLLLLFSGWHVSSAGSPVVSVGATAPWGERSDYSSPPCTANGLWQCPVVSVAETTSCFQIMDRSFFLLVIILLLVQIQPDLRNHFSST